MDLEQIINEKVDFYAIEHEFPKICEEYGLDYEEAYSLLSEEGDLVKGAKTGAAAGAGAQVAVTAAASALVGFSLFTVSGIVVATLLGAAIGTTIAKINKEYQKSKKGCKKYSGANSDLCLKLAQIKETEAKLKILEKAKKECKNAKNPAKCTKKLDSGITKASRNLDRYTTRVKELKSKGAKV